MRFTTICGSLGQKSSNAAALSVVADTLRARGATVASAQIRDIPAFDPSQVDDAPPSVAALRHELECSDGLVIASPEYAGGVAGSTKNALDWLVGSASLYHKVVVVISVGTTGGAFAIEQLVRTLSWQGALVVDTLGISAPRTKMSDQGFEHPETVQAITRLANHLFVAGSEPPAAILNRVAATVARYGIDPERFGTVLR